jgi:16S rRNA (guanine(966)-N(2))-methyltransferase RsmD
VRIITGTHRSHQFNPPANLNIRPTTDFAKESLFNIINNYFYFEQLEQVLDLFSGTGSISYEFASRGSKNITAVDNNFKSTNFIKQSADKLKFNNIHVVKTDVFNFLNFNKQPYDLIFADPPYDMGEKIMSIPDLVFANKLLNKDGWLIIEHSKEINFEKHPNFFQHRNYGKVNFSVFILV